MATKKKNALKMPSGRVNKSAWIRSQPTSVSAKDVVKKAKSEGIKLSLAQVYTARSTAKKTSASAGRRSATVAATPASKRATALQPARPAVSGELRRQFAVLAVRIGTDEAQRLLDRIADVKSGG